MVETSRSVSKGVMVYSEDSDLLCELLRVGKAVASKLGVGVSALLIGHGMSEECRKQPARYGAHRTLVVDDPRLEFFSADLYKAAVLWAVRVEAPEVLLVGGTKKGKELAPMVAAALGTGCMTDCTFLDVDDEKRLVGRRLTYGGSSVAEVVSVKKPQLATVPPKVFEKQETPGAEGEEVSLKAELPEPRVKVVERRKKRQVGFRIEEAPVVIGCGRAFKKKEDMQMLEELAGVLDAKLSCTRPLAADYHWFEEWIGLSGHKIRPRLYISCGVSGTIQHVAGIRDAQTIVAINSDESAAIFSVADYAVVGDVYKVVPALTKLLKERASR